MWLKKLRQLLLGRRQTPRRDLPAARRKRFRPFLESLEARTLPSSYTAGTVTDLIADIGLANQAGGANTITLNPGASFSLTAVNDSTYGPTGLPVIAANNNLTINGNGDTIARSAPSAPLFRLLAVGSGATLTLTNLTLTNGASGGHPGGGIYNVGTLTLNGVTVYNNTAGGHGPDGGGIYNAGGSVTLASGTVINTNWALAWFGNNAYGAGIYNAGGSLTVQSGTIIEYNQCRPSKGVTGASGFGGGIYSSGGSVTVQNAAITSNSILYGDSTQPNGTGGNAYGGGVYVAGGTFSLTSSTVSGNIVRGGYALGNGYGGGVYVAGGTVTLSNSSVQSNTASGYTPTLGNGYGGGVYVAGGTVTMSGDTVQSNAARNQGTGGGLYIASAATVYLDAFTLAHIAGNTPNDIVGSYILQP